jgi:hypothetical protein
MYHGCNRSASTLRYQNACIARRAENRAAYCDGKAVFCTHSNSHGGDLFSILGHIKAADFEITRYSRVNNCADFVAR